MNDLLDALRAFWSGTRAAIRVAIRLAVVAVGAFWLALILWVGAQTHGPIRWLCYASPFIAVAVISFVVAASRPSIPSAPVAGRPAPAAEPGSAPPARVTAWAADLPSAPPAAAGPASERDQVAAQQGPPPIEAPIFSVTSLDERRSTKSAGADREGGTPA